MSSRVKKIRSVPMRRFSCKGCDWKLVMRHRDLRMSRHTAWYAARGDAKHVFVTEEL